MTFRPLSEAFIRRSRYSVLPVLDTTGRCGVKTAVIGVTELIAALVPIHCMLAFLDRGQNVILVKLILLCFGELLLEVYECVYECKFRVKSSGIETESTQTSCYNVIQCNLCTYRNMVSSCLKNGIIMSFVDASHVPLTFNFLAEDPGRYRCQIILRRSAPRTAHRGTGNQLSACNVRVFQLCCTVLPQGNKATIEFASPVNTQVVQNIPVVSDAVADNCRRMCNDMSDVSYTSDIKLCLVVGLGLVDLFRTRQSQIRHAYEPIYEEAQELHVIFTRTSWNHSIYDFCPVQALGAVVFLLE